MVMKWIVLLKSVLVTLKMMQILMLIFLTMLTRKQGWEGKKKLKVKEDLEGQEGKGRAILRVYKREKKCRKIRTRERETNAGRTEGERKK